MLTTVKKIGHLVLTIIAACAWSVAVLLTAILIFVAAFCLMSVDVPWLAAKNLVDSLNVFFGLCALSICAAMVLIELLRRRVRSLPVRRIASGKTRLLRNRLLWICVAVCSLVLVTMWLWADIVDSAFALVFVTIAHLHRKRWLRPRNIHGWILFYLAGGFAILVNSDKAIDYPLHYWEDLYFTEWLLWAAINCYALWLLLRSYYRPWSWVGVALLVIYFPIVELPSELTRQYFGRLLTGSMDHLYFTKLRTHHIYAAEPGRGNVTVFKREAGLNFKYMDKYSFLDGGGISGYAQALRTPYLALRLKDCFIPWHGDSWRMLLETFDCPPSDEEMIRIFSSNQAAFYRLVDLWRTYDGCAGKRCAEDMREFWQYEQRLGVKMPLSTVVFDTDEVDLWLPKPYSIDTAKQVTALDFKEKRRACCQYGALAIKPLDSRYRTESFSHGFIKKEFYYFPQAPRIENGYLLWPVDANGRITKKCRVLTTLNSFPKDWKNEEYLLRQLSPNFYIRLYKLELPGDSTHTALAWVYALIFTFIVPR